MLTTVQDVYYSSAVYRVNEVISSVRTYMQLTDSSRYYVTFLIDDYAYAQVVSRFAGHGKWAWMC